MFDGTTPGPHPGPTPRTETYKWWPFMIVIGVLVIMAVGWFIYARSKSQEQEKQDVVQDEYFSMQPQSKVDVAPESGLEFAKEGEGDKDFTKESGLEDDDDDGLN